MGFIELESRCNLFLNDGDLILINKDYIVAIEENTQYREYEKHETRTNIQLINGFTYTVMSSLSEVKQLISQA